MRVLIVGLGGVSRTFRNWPEPTLGQALVRAGHEVHAITYWQPRSPQLGLERREERLPALKKTRREKRTLVWVDQAGFYLLPAFVRTYAPRGQTPIVRAPLGYEHLSVISALTMSGRLLVQMQERAYDGDDVVRFLRHLLRQIEGKLLIIWDGAPIHRSKAVTAFLAAGGAKRIHLE